MQRKMRVNSFTKKYALKKDYEVFMQLYKENQKLRTKNWNPFKCICLLNCDERSTGSSMARILEELITVKQLK